MLCMYLDTRNVLQTEGVVASEPLYERSLESIETSKVVVSSVTKLAIETFIRYCAECVFSRLGSTI